MLRQVTRRVARLATVAAQAQAPAPGQAGCCTLRRLATPTPTPTFHGAPHARACRRLASGSAAMAASSEQQPVVVRVHTGNMRGAGTESTVELRLVGTHGEESDALVLSEGLERSSIVEAQVDVGATLGAVVGVRVVSDCTGDGAGWFLDKVEVGQEDAQAGDSELQTFSCGRWIGAADVGGFDGPPEADLRVEDALRNSIDDFVMRFSAQAIPHPAKVKEGARGVVTRTFGHGGEDSYAVYAGEHFTVMTVADGIYAWRHEGIDSGVLSRALVQHISELARQQPAEAGAPSPEWLLQQAWDQTRADQIEGSTTVCVVCIDHATGVLRSANIGDSGFLVVRGLAQEPQLIFRTGQQEHEFGFPFQLGSGKTTSQPSDCDSAVIQLNKGDVIVAGTDGLFDNLADSSIIDAVRDSKHAWNAARDVTKAAFAVSVEKRLETPYSRAAEDAFGMWYTGGKRDDIAVIVAQLE